MIALTPAALQATIGGERVFLSRLGGGQTWPNTTLLAYLAQFAPGPIGFPEDD